ncbi:MAG: MFS transporter [Spongiibacteraceae bacterium]
MTVIDSINELSQPSTHTTKGLYKYYALAVLLGVGMVNAADRQIMSVLTEAIKHDLQVDDAQIAFLFGTAFVTLYTLLGLPLARLADRMKRTHLLAGGLTLWAGMTAMGGVAPGFGLLATARFGVGIGEATANPVCHSLICDYFPRRRRAMALGTYLASMFLGGGLAAAIGGHILKVWPDSCSALQLCAVKPWQAAFLIVGIPGLFLALLVWTLRNPVRGEIDGHPIVPPATGHWPAFFRDLASVVPFTCTWILWRDCGARAAVRNMIYSGVLLAAAIYIGLLSGDRAQWLALFIAVNAILGWAQRTAIVDPALIRLTFLTPAFTLALMGFSIMGCIMGAASFWMIPFAIRTFHVDASTAGTLLGAAIGVSSIIGVIGGGAISDRWRAVDARGYLWASIAALITLIVTLTVMLKMQTLHTYAIALFVFNAASISWSGAAAAYAQDLVLPRMRATTAAVFALTITLVVMAIGPYAAGKIGGATGSLSEGLFRLMALGPVALLFFWLAARLFPAAETSKFERAAAAGEK